MFYGNLICFLEQKNTFLLSSAKFKTTTNKMRSLLKVIINKITFHLVNLVGNVNKQLILELPVLL